MATLTILVPITVPVSLGFSLRLGAALLFAGAVGGGGITVTFAVLRRHGRSFGGC